MPNLKCIGGPNDGEIVRFDQDQTEVALNKSEPVSISGHKSQFGLSDGSVKFKRTLYTRRCVHLPGGGKVEFLAADTWTDEEALRHALAP